MKLEVFECFGRIYLLVNVYIILEHHHAIDGKTHVISTGPCSIARHLMALESELGPTTLVPYVGNSWWGVSQDEAWWKTLGKWWLNGILWDEYPLVMTVT